MKRVFNFGAGPATLPVSVLEEASRGILEVGGSGMSVLEVSHRSKVYEAIHFDARDRLLKALGLDASEYGALFLGGGIHRDEVLKEGRIDQHLTVELMRRHGVMADFAMAALAW